MKISNGTIDCLLYVHGRNANEMTDSYSDFQHHHWTIMSSAEITSAVGYNSSYIWTLNGFGHDNFGSWSETNLSRTLSAQFRINSSNMVTLTQLNPATNIVQAIGSNSHPVSEQTWPADLTWSATPITTPTSITWKDLGGPSYKLLTTPVPVPSAQKAFGRNVLTLLQSITLVPGPGFGGRDWTMATQWWQKPAKITATAWWSWNINLVP